METSSVAAPELYPLTFGQQQLLFAESLGTPRTLVFSSRIPLWDGVSVTHIAEVLAAVTRRHDALRMSVTDDDATGQVVTLERVVVAIPPGADLQSFGVYRSATTVGRAPMYFAVDRATSPPILTVYLHHAFVDGWSAALISSEFSWLYPALLDGRRPRPLMPAGSFGAYAEAVRRGMTGERLRRHLRFWFTELDGAVPLALPYLARPWHPGVRIGQLPAVVFEISDCTGDGLLAGAPALHGSVSTGVLAALAAALSVSTGQRDLLLQTALADRGGYPQRRLVGCLANLASLRVRLPVRLSPAEIIRAARSALARSARHQVGPFQHDGRKLPQGQVLNVSPRVTVAFNQDINTQADPALVGRSKPVNPRQRDGCVMWDVHINSIDDLHIEVQPGPRHLPLRLRVAYRPDLWQAEGIETLCLDIARWLRRLAGGCRHAA